MVLAWSFATLVPAATASTPVGPFTMDPTNREDVRRLFYAVHQASEGVPIGWTGSIAGCDPGTVSADYLAATLTRINYFRAMAGVPSDVTFTPANNAEAQAAALIMSSQRALSHDPPPSWTCWTQLGRDGAARSNLTLGNTGPSAIDALVRDGDLVGHRRTMLNPQILSMGSGSVPQTSAGDAAEAQLMVDNPSPPAPQRPARDEFVAWPPRGFVPYQIVYPRWSFVLRDADFTNATVTMRRPGGAAVPATITSRADFAGPGLVWLANSLADGDSWPRPVNDEAITVTVANVVVGGVARSFTYTTTVFDPAVADPSRTPLTITGPTQPPLNQTSTYTVNSIPNAVGYQWRTTRLAPFALTDGAEAGLANFDAFVGGYNPISSAFAATGTSSFRLTTGQPGGLAGTGPQTLTLKRTLVPNAASQMTFKTRANLLDNITAVAEVSADDGVSWNIVYAEAATRDTAFNNRVVPLGQFAGQHLRLRLRAQNAGTGGTFCCGSEGWYVDDVTLSNLQVADAPTLSAVNAARSFNFTPTVQAEFDLNVRPEFVGSGFGAWSPSKRVSTVTTSSLASALDNTQLPWSTSGDASWTGQTQITQDGVDAAQAGDIGDNQSSTLQTTVTGPIKLSFWWKADSEADFDFLRVTVDGVEPFAGISGNVNWQKKTITLTEGSHTIRWSYTKDDSVSSGQDTAWLDQVTTSTK